MKAILNMIIIVSLGLLSACQLFQSNTDPKLPPITTDGKETFGCQINGKVWLPLGVLGQPGTYSEYRLTSDTTRIIIYADNGKTVDGFTISVFDSPEIKINQPYDLSNPQFNIEYSDGVNLPICFYGSVTSGNLTFLRLDTSKKILSGIFEIRCLSKECNKTVTITNGRFDLNFD